MLEEKNLKPCKLLKAIASLFFFYPLPCLSSQVPALVMNKSYTVFVGCSVEWLQTVVKIQPELSLWISSFKGETHNLQTLHTILSTGSPLKSQSYEYVYKHIKSSVLLGSISGDASMLYAS